MPVYRIYFRGDGTIVGRDDFEAENDDAAIVMAELLYDACADCCDEFELWQGTSQIDRSSLRPPSRNFAMTPNMRETLRQRQEAIRNSHWSIAKSKRLAGRIGDSERDRDTPRAPDRAQARRWQMKAEELRTLAEQTRNPSARKSLLRVAATYETLAEHEERQATVRERTG